MEFLKKYWQKILIGVGVFAIIYLLILILTKKPEMSELDKYKLEQLDKHIGELKNLQKSLNDSINSYNQKVKDIDKKISNIKIEKKEVNNYYFQKKEEIKNLNNKQLDSLFKKRYNF